MMRIRLWQAIDVDQLHRMISEFLRVGAARGGDVLPSEHNVQVLLSMGLGFADLGQPSLVALDDDTVLGFIEWGYPPMPFEERWRTCRTYGSFVLPWERHKLVAQNLRDEAFTICRRDGIERIIGPVHMTNERGIREFAEHVGAWAVSVQMEVLL